MRELLNQVADRANQAGVFAQVRAQAQALVCRAKAVESDAEYRIDPDGGSWWVGLYTPDRWLSESIEADLMHMGDKLEDLLEEELVDQGYLAGTLSIEHFRDDQKRYVFRSPLPVSQPEVEKADAATVQTVTQILLAYEACFRQLGDMSPKDELV